MYNAVDQSHYREVPQWEIFMEQELRFGPAFQVFIGKKEIQNIVAAALNSCIK